MKPETWTDSKVVALSPLARLLFIGSWNFADDYGCLPADAMQLKLRVLPADDGDAEALVGELLEAGLLELLESSGGVQFWHITNWDRHQRVSHAKESDYGDPTTWCKPATRGNDEASMSLANVPEVSGEFMGEGNGRERKGTEGIAPESARGISLNDLKSALVDLFGEPPPQNWSLYNRIATWIRDQDGTPEEVRLKAARIAEEWGPKACTVTALEKHWNRYDAEVGQLSAEDVKRYQAEVRRLQRRKEIHGT